MKHSIAQVPNANQIITYKEKPYSKIITHSTDTDDSSDEENSSDEKDLGI